MTPQRLLISLSAFAALLVFAPAAPAAFPGRNGLIAFNRAKGGLWDIWVMDPSTAKEVDITNTADIAEAQAAFSPDGRTVAFAWSPGADPGPGAPFVGAGIGMINSNGSGMRRVVTADAGQSVAEPAWTADGRTILFQKTDASGSQSIWAVDAASGAQRQLTPGPNDSSPLGSPDGAHIAYFRRVAATYPNPSTQEAVGDANGANPVAAGTNLVSDWSPDGSRFLYSLNGLYTANGFLVGIFTSAIDGSGQTKVADLPAQDVEPEFSPDGQSIVWTNEGSHDLWIVPAGGGQPRNLTNQTGFEFHPTWGPAAPPDTTPPAGTLTGKSRQKLSKTLTVTVGCDEVCTAKVSGTVTVHRPSQSYRLPGTTQPVAAGSPTVLSLNVSKKISAALRKALKHHLKVQAHLKVVLRDIAGNAKTLTRTLTLRL